MSKQSLDAFRAKLDEDANLRRQLAERAQNTSGEPLVMPVDTLIEFAQSQGYEFTAAEVRAENAELGDDELDRVAGGAGYLKIGDIKGESTDSSHKDWINLLSVSPSLNRRI